MPKKSRSKSKRILRSCAHDKEEKKNDNKKIHKTKDKYILKLKEYFLFSECMFYNKEFLCWQIPFLPPQTTFLKLNYQNSITWKNFTYHKLIGQGSFGKGFIASLKQNKNNNEKINIKPKICLIKMIGAKVDENIENHYSQLINERDCLIKLSGICTPKLFACFIEPKVAAIFVQEFIDGESITYVKKLIKIDNGVELYPILEDVITKNGKNIKDIPTLTQRQFDIIQFYVGELLAAVKFIHDKGVLHRDLKENNILLTCYGHLKLIDFGLAKRVCRHFESKEGCSCVPNCSTSQLLRSYVSGPHRLWGNRYYAAPEYISGEKNIYDEKGDFWAIGILFFHLLFGCRPYKHIIRDKVKELFLSISNWKTESFMQKSILNQRCKNHPQIIEAFFSLIADENRRLSDFLRNKEKKWIPMSWELFKNINLLNIYKGQPPIKIPSNKKVYTLNNQIPLSVIRKSFSKEKYIEHLDCPYFNYITPFNNDLFNEVI